jgi:hypothetical protein
MKGARLVGAFKDGNRSPHAKSCRLNGRSFRFTASCAKSYSEKSTFKRERFKMESAIRSAAKSENAFS